MAFQVLLSLCTIAVVTAQYGGYKHVEYKEEHYDPHPEYKFEYSVHDAHTGDIKSQQEERHGDSVHGNYKLKEADGSERYVEYTADHKNGFNAVVHRQHNVHPTGHHAPVYHAPVYHAPVHPVYHAPVSHAPVFHAPIHPVYHAPVHHLPLVKSSYSSSSFSSHY